MAAYGLPSMAIHNPKAHTANREELRPQQAKLPDHLAPAPLRTVGDVQVALLRSGPGLTGRVLRLLAQRAAEPLNPETIAALVCDAGLPCQLGRKIVRICAAQLTRLAPADSFLGWLALMERLAMHLFGACNGKKCPIEQLEAALHAPGAITRVPEAGSDWIFFLTSTDPNPTAEFGSLVREARRRMRATQKSFAATYAAWSLKQVAVSEWERGRYVPGRAFGTLVMHMAVTCDLPQLYAAYVAARAQLEQSPRAAADDVDFAGYLVGHEAAVRQLVGAASPNTVKTRLQAVSYAMVVDRLPANSRSARTRGLGRTGEQGPIAILDPAVIDYLPEFFASRRGGERDTFGDRLVYQRLAKMVRPHGPMWHAADEFAGRFSAQPWLPTHWPDDSDSPGAPCLSTTERIRAQCYLGHQKYKQLASYCAAVPLRRETKFDALLVQHPFPLVGVFRVLRRLNPAEADQRMLASLIATCALRSLSARGGCSERHISERHDGGYDLCLYSMGREQRIPIAKELEFLFAPYHAWRSSVDAPRRPYYIDSTGKSLGRRALNNLSRRLTRKIASDVFPAGLSPHDMPAIVATELTARYGVSYGCRLASVIVGRPAEIVRDRLQLVVGLPESLPAGKTATVSGALARASRESAATRLPKPMPADFVRRRRSPGKLLLRQAA